MDYKISIANDEVEEDTIIEVFETLQKIVIDQKNIDLKNPVPFISEGKSTVLTGTTWGVSRPDMADVEELSRLYPNLTLHVIKAGSVLNGNHFEDLTHYSLSIYEDGELREILKPEPIVWKSVHKVEYLPSPWA